MKALLSVADRYSVDSAGIAQIARVKGLAADGQGDTQTIAASMASDRVQRFLKAAVGGIGTDETALVDQSVIVGAFVELMKRDSVFYALLADGMVRLPLRTWVEMLAMQATGWIVGEGQPIPVTSAGFDRTYLEPIKAASLAVVTRELLKAGSAEAILTRALRLAVGAAVDTEFFAHAIDGDTTAIPSTGGDLDSIAADLKALLDAVAPTTASRLVLAIDPPIQRAASMVLNLAGGFAFPDLTPTGGTIKGIPAMPSSSIGAGKVALLDASRFAGQSENIDIDASGQATVEMLDAALQQNAITGAGAAQVSMFQTGAVALKAVAMFGVHRLENSASAVVTGATWGGAYSGS
ncbi:hypothetical protein IC608_09130 [Devosia sp. PTR5]|uniref:Phage major capsid protein n=1 Tax=Devosia oryzisoli TaxID=2774138 RepID=A0A927FVK1_9HYPH|nr:hypothetical protein [Devosia oryzisoli]MBD8065638.1 hypothetical protein [Devosia oryzisoli]